jgi:hypothetical protein
VCGKCGQNFLLLRSWHLEEVKRSPKLSCDFIELGGRDLQLAVGLFEARGLGDAAARLERMRKALDA